MKNLKALLDQVKATKGIESDYALAKALNLPKQRISDYYKGKTSPDKYACMKIAECLNKPLTDVIYQVELDVEKDEKRREEWRRFYKNMGGIAASVATLLFFAVTLIVTPIPAEASIGKASLPDALYYVKL